MFVHHAQNELYEVAPGIQYHLLTESSGGLLFKFDMLVISSQLPNHLFEELAMDVYDEVDRRENDSSE